MGFLGLSDPNMVSWGQILHVAQDYMTVAWWTSLFPGAAICLAVVGLNLFADGLNEIVDPRLRGRTGRAPVMSAARVEGAPLLSVRNLKVHMRVGDTVVRAVDGIDFSVGAGESIGIVGESGSGKSTLARAILKLLPNVELAALQGEVYFRGIDLTRISEPALRDLRRHHGFSMIFQDPLGLSQSDEAGGSAGR